MPLYVDPATGGTMAMSAKDALRWQEMPYGRWWCADGREILFNRQYNPLWERTAGNMEWTSADRTEWVAGIAEQSWFYNDGDRDAAKERKALAELSARGLPKPDRSALVRATRGSMRRQRGIRL